MERLTGDSPFMSDEDAGTEFSFSLFVIGGACEESGTLAVSFDEGSGDLDGVTLFYGASSFFLCPKSVGAMCAYGLA
jgi:hypothetical protein